jgi:hypothetical protein
MSNALPTTIADWLAEISEHFALAALAAAGQDFEEEAQQAQWVYCIQQQAIDACRLMRGLSSGISAGAVHVPRLPEQEADELEMVDEIAHSLRNNLPRDVRDVVSEQQLFLLFYVAAHVRAELLRDDVALRVVHGCWESLGDEHDDEPWDINNPPPEDISDWVDEIKFSYRQISAPVTITLDDEQVFTATNLLEAAAVIALHQRDVVTSQRGLGELIESIRAIENDVVSMGPEWDHVSRIPAVAFAMYYVWVHLAIGLVDEETATTVLQQCTRRISEFGDSELDNNNLSL